MARAFAAALLASMLVVPAQAIAEAPVADRVAVQDENGRTVAEAGIVAFLRKSQSGRRPVTFVIGGGPGTSSAYLNLGALGPSRIVLSGAASDLRPLVVNEETWLGLTDLIFVDPPGTGQGRLLRTDAKKIGRAHV